MTNPIPQQIFVVVPSFNEGPMISQVLGELVQEGLQVVVVDDGSLDDTVQIALTHPVYVLQHPFNLGQGAALQTGIVFSLKHHACRYIVTFDADGQHQAADVLKLVEILSNSEADVVLGTRFFHKSRPPSLRTSRFILLKLAIWWTRLTTGLKVTDTHNGLRAFTAEAADRIQLTQNQMSHATQILTQISLLKLKYIEALVSIQYTDYSLKKGQSIWNTIDILWDTFVGGLK
jgi:glycosyltransferase involved in cell wall biosynthesis